MILPFLIKGTGYSPGGRNYIYVNDVATAIVNAMIKDESENAIFLEIKT